MVRDFGGAQAPRWRKGERCAYLHRRAGQAGLIAALLLMAFLPTAMPGSLEEVKLVGPSDARPEGKLCRPIDEAAFDRGWGGRAFVFTFSGVTFARRRGDADCTAGKHGLFGVVGAIYPTCRFDAPFQLGVTRGGRTTYFAVPGGYEAVVAAAPEGVRCTVTHRFDIYALADGL